MSRLISADMYPDSLVGNFPYNAQEQEKKKKKKKKKKEEEEEEVKGW